MKRAIITGVNGQDGSYLSELLLSKGYEVIGLIRRSSSDVTIRLKTVLGHPDFHLLEADITDAVSINDLVIDYKPEELYNLAAQSHVATSFKQPLMTLRVNTEGVLNILEALKNHSPQTRFYQASTSEMFGKNFNRSYDLKEEYRYEPHVMFPRVMTNGDINWGPVDRYTEIRSQNESTPFAPQSPYAVAKVAAHQAVGLYREAYGLHASCGILFNHESERRGEQFLTRKVTRWLGRYLAFSELHDPTGVTLKLGNLSPKRDWGHAEDYVEAMWMMLQQDQPEDYVISSGQTHSVEDFVKLAFQHAGLYGEYNDLVEIDPSLIRPAEVDYLLGDCTKAKEKLGWTPKTDFNTLVSRMVESDIELARKEVEYANTQ